MMQKGLGARQALLLNSDLESWVDSTLGPQKEGWARGLHCIIGTQFLSGLYLTIKNFIQSSVRRICRGQLVC